MLDKLHHNWYQYREQVSTPCGRAEDMADQGMDDGESYVKRMRNIGYADEQIREKLHEVGWTEGQINALLTGYEAKGSGGKGADRQPWWHHALVVVVCVLGGCWWLMIVIGFIIGVIFMGRAVVEGGGVP